MNATEKPTSGTDAMSPEIPARKKKSWIWSAVLAVCVFGAGGIVGGAGTLLVIRHHLSEFIRHPNDAPDRILPWVKRRLRLDDVQMVEVDRIVREHHRKLQEIRHETTPKVREELVALQTEVSAVLRPQQRELWNRRLDQMSEFWFPVLPPLPEREEEKASQSAP